MAPSDDPRALVHARKAQTCLFADDGVIPNHPKWPLIVYRGAVRLPDGLDPASVLEQLFARLGRGDVAILPAGTGHRRIEASSDFLAVGAYPASGVYDECRSREDREKALPAIALVARQAQDPVYGEDGPLTRLWPPQSGG